MDKQFRIIILLGVVELTILTMIGAYFLFPKSSTPTVVPAGEQSL